MKLDSTPVDKVTMSSGMVTTDFSIKASAKAFQILSDGLYSDKITAVLRELGCNAYDSHVLAGDPDRQFDVHLPTSMSPWFSLRDYGVGLDAHEVTHIYTTYFESTKTDSDDFVGALGLGSKSPFSYTDNFTITAIKLGVKNIYSAFINEMGFPSVVLMATSDSHEASGVEIKFAVDNTYDVRLFSDRAKEVYQWFNTIPNILGNKIDIVPVVYKEENIVPGVHILEHSTVSRALMGNIAYPISTRDIPNEALARAKIDPETFSRLKSYLGQNLVIEFAIGAIDFSASRETLSYTTKTISAVVAKLLEIENNLVDEFSKSVEMNTDGNVWQLMKNVTAKAQTKIYEHAAGQWLLKNKDRVPYDITAVNLKYGWGSLVLLNIKDIQAAYNVDIRSYRRSTSYAAPSGFVISEHGKGSTTVTLGDYNIYDHLPVFVTNQNKTLGIARLKGHFRQRSNPAGQIVLLTRHDNSLPADFDGFFEFIHSPPKSCRIEISSLDKTTTVSKGTTGKNCFMNLRVQGKTYYGHGYEWLWEANKTDTVMELAKNSKVPYLYTTMVGFHNSRACGNSIDLKILMENLQNSNLPQFQNLPIYGVRKDGMKLIDKNWQPVEKWLIKQLKLLPDEFWEIIVRDSATLIPSVILSMNQRDVDMIDDKTSTAHEFLQLEVNKTKRPKFTMQDVQYTKRLALQLGFNVDIDKKQAILAANNLEFLTKYPMIKYVKSSTTDSDVTTSTLEYINLINKQPKNKEEIKID